MRATSYLSIAFTLAVVIALVVFLFLDSTKTVVTYLAVFGGIALGIGGIVGVVRGERRERA